MWKEKVLKIIKPKALISKLEEFYTVVALICINISSKSETHKPSLDLNKFPESGCVYKTHPYNISLSFWLQELPRWVFSVFVPASRALVM
jgi:hypothetical protein